MTQIKKHVTSLKIGHFIQKNKLVLFFGASKSLTNQTSFIYAQGGSVQAQTARHVAPQFSSEQLMLKDTALSRRANELDCSSIASLFGVLTSRADHSLRSELSSMASLLTDCSGNKKNREHSCPIRPQHVLSNNKNRIIFLVKNKVAIATLLSNFKAVSTISLSRSGSGDLSTPGLASLGYLPKGIEASGANKQQNESPSFDGWSNIHEFCPPVGTHCHQASLIKKSALFQGPVALLGVSEAKQLEELVAFCKQQKSLLLLGGFYNNLVISHTQIDKLAALSQKGQERLILNLLHCIQTPTQRFLHTICKNLSLPVLDRPQHQLMRLFVIRRTQLLARSQSECVMQARKAA